MTEDPDGTNESEVKSEIGGENGPYWRREDRKIGLGL